MKFSRFVYLFIAVQMLLSIQLFAALPPKIGVSGNLLLINGKTAISFIKENGNLSPSDRAQTAYQRLNALVDAGLSADSIYAKTESDSSRVYAGFDLICIATKQDAKAVGVSPMSLASSWANRIRTLLSLPAISFSTNKTIVPVGETRSIRVGGIAEGPIQAVIDNSSIASVDVNQELRLIVVRGNNMGYAICRVIVGGESSQFLVNVRKFAGFMKAVPTVKITGNPCPEDVAELAVRQEVIRNASLEPGVSFKITGISGHKGDYAVSSNRMVRVAVKITGEGYLDYATVLPIVVSNLSMRYEKPEVLFYSNNPERLLKFQQLFNGQLEFDKPSRILYHHQSALASTARFLVDIINPNNESISLRVTRGTPEPMVDTVIVGYVAGRSFLRDYYSNTSVIETLPAQSRLVLFSESLGNLKTASGILQITQLTKGQGALLRVQALPLGIDDVAQGSITPSPNALIAQLSDHRYLMPVKQIEAQYTVGKNWAFINMGKQALTNGETNKVLYGNYGVSYEIKVKINNPTEVKKKVNVLFDPTAGFASGTFMIDGKLTNARFVKPPTEYTLASYDLKPGEERNIQIQTIPLAGSNYPAKIIVRS